jgi:hypothetical protein
MFGHIQIYEQTGTDPSKYETNILITLDKQKLKTTGITFSKQLESTIVIGSFIISLNIAKKIIDKIIDAYIVDGVITILGPNDKILYSGRLGNDVLLNVDRRKVIK